MQLSGKEICPDTSKWIKSLQKNPDIFIKVTRGKVLDQLKPGTWLRHKNSLEYMVAGRWEGNWVLVPRNVASGEDIVYTDKEMTEQMKKYWTILSSKKEKT